MSAVLVDLFPLFCLAFLGFFLRVRGVWQQAMEKALTQLAFMLAVPALLFLKLSQIELPPEPPWLLWLGYNGSTLFVLAFVVTVSRLALKEPMTGAAAQGLAASFSNTVVVGIPLHLAVFGPQASLPLFGILLVHGPLLLISATLIAELDRSARSGASGTLLRRVGSAFLASLKNPIIASILLGGLWNLSGVPVPTLGVSFLEVLSDLALPLAMLVLGVSLAGLRIEGQVPKILLILVGKLFLLPLVVGVMVFWVLPLPPLWAALCFLNAMLPTGLNPLLFAHHYEQSQRSVASAVLIGTALGLFGYAIAASLLVPPLAGAR